MSLTPKQEAFCLAYAKTGNATEAYRNAGYDAVSEDAIRANASRLLTKVNIQNRLRELAQEVASPKIATIAQIQEGLTRIFLGLEKETVYRYNKQLQKEVPEQREPALSIRVKAGTELAKMLGAYVVNVNMSGDVKVNNPLSGLTTEELRKLIKDG